MAMWESWRYEIDRSCRDAELSRSQRMPEREHERALPSAKDRERRPSATPASAVGWLYRLAQATAGWFL